MLRILLAAFIMLLSPPLWAQNDVADKATARTLFEEAGAAMEARDYERAADLYARANALYPAPTSALGEARALVKLGRLVDASERYLALTKLPLADDASDAFKLAVESARAEREVVLELLSALTITREEGGKVSLDGKVLDPATLGVKRWVDPGTHRITVHVRGGDDITREITVEEGQVLPIDLTGVGPPPVAPKTAPPPGPTAKEPAEESTGASHAQRIAGFALIGVGGASLVVAIITGGAYLSAKDTVEEQCNARFQCTQEGLDAADSGRTLGVVNAVTLFGGIAVAAAGVAVLLTAPDDTEVALWPLLAPTAAGAGLRARF